MLAGPSRDVAPKKRCALGTLPTAAARGSNANTQRSLSVLAMPTAKDSEFSLDSLTTSAWCMPLMPQTTPVLYFGYAPTHAVRFMHCNCVPLKPER